MSTYVTIEVADGEDLTEIAPELPAIVLYGTSPSYKHVVNGVIKAVLKVSDQ